MNKTKSKRKEKKMSKKKLVAIMLIMVLSVCSMTDMGSLFTTTTNASEVKANELTLSTKEEADLLIKSEAEFFSFANKVTNGENYKGKIVKLMCDLDMSPYESFYGVGSTYKAFKGTFDGSGHTISNAKVTTDGKKYCGLFNYVEKGEVKNLSVSNLSINGQSDTCSATGGIVGKGKETVISNCTVQGGSVLSNKTVGTIVGEALSCTIRNCGVSGNKLSGQENVGGIIGEATYSTTIENSFFKGELAGTNNIGGLAGCGTVQLKNCYVIPTITASEDAKNAGLIIGNSNSSGSASTCYYLQNEKWGVTGSQENTNFKATAYTDEKFKTADFLAQLNANKVSENADTWTSWLNGENGYPRLAKIKQVFYNKVTGMTRKNYNQYGEEGQKYSVTLQGENTLITVIPSVYLYKDHTKIESTYKNYILSFVMPAEDVYLDYETITTTAAPRTSEYGYYNKYVSDEFDDGEYRTFLQPVTLSMPFGVYMNPITVEISHPLKNTIYYSINDGSTNIYFEPLTISESCRLSSYVKDSYGLRGDYSSGNYTILSELSFSKKEVSVKESKTIYMNDYLSVKNVKNLNTDLKWESSDPSVAKVDSDGTVSAKKVGMAVITAKTADNYSINCVVKVTAPTISITKSKTLKMGKSTTLSISPGDYRTRVKWTSNNKKIATVNKKGKVVAKAPGTCTITATYGNQKKKCKITVPKVKIKLNAKKITVGYKKVKNLKVTTNLDKNLIKWKTSNPKVAKIGSNGKIIPMGAGTCKIIAYYKKYKASCTVKIPASVIKVSAPKKITTKRDVYYAYVEKHNIQGGDGYSLKVDWSKVAHASGYEVKLYWRGEENYKETQTVNIIKQNGKYYYSSVSSGIYHTGIYKTVKDLVYHVEGTNFSSKKLSLCVAGGSCEEIYKVSIRSYKFINGKRFYSKTKSKKVK